MFEPTSESPKPNRAERRAQRKWKVDEFRDQAFEAKSQMASIVLLVGPDEIPFEIPHPLALDDETQARVEAFQRGDGLDRAVVIGEDGEPLKDLFGEPVTRIREPHQIKGVVLEPVSTRSARAILGDAKHAEFVAAGGRSNDITQAFDWMVTEYKDRLEADPK